MTMYYTKIVDLQFLVTNKIRVAKLKVDRTTMFLLKKTGCASAASRYDHNNLLPSLQ